MIRKECVLVVRPPIYSGNLQRVFWWVPVETLDEWLAVSNEAYPGLWRVATRDDWAIRNRYTMREMG